MTQTAVDQAVALIRKARGDTPQQKFGVKADLTGETINRIERGATVPTLPTLDKIADSVDCDIVILFKPRPARQKVTR